MLRFWLRTLYLLLRKSALIPPAGASTSHHCASVWFEPSLFALLLLRFVFLRFALPTLYLSGASAIGARFGLRGRSKSALTPPTGASSISHHCASAWFEPSRFPQFLLHTL